MQEKPPSRSARRVAEFRAVHQILENGAIFQDTFAKLMLDEDVRVIAGRDATVPVLRSIRLFMAVRSRFTEDTLAAAVARGVQHAVALGAGLDTFFLRNSYPNSKLRVFELDSPGTQAWKLARLAQAAISIPPSVSFIPILGASKEREHGRMTYEVETKRNGKGRDLTFDENGSLLEVETRSESGQHSGTC